MKTIQKDNGQNGAFFLINNEEEIGQIDYVWLNDSTIVINHTEVNPAYEGEGLGRVLVNAVADFARQKDLKIVPVCPYAKEVMQSSERYNDVLA